MNRSDNIADLATALAKAQAKLKVAQKDVTNSFYKSQYAGLPQVWEACREALASNGLSIAQLTDTSENGMVLTTMLMHVSGQWLSSVYPIDPVKKDPQGFGSAMTYARRYSLMAIVGVVADDADDDDDGNMTMDTKKLRAEEAAQKAIEIISSHKTRRELERWNAGATSSLERLQKMDKESFDRVQNAYNIAIADLAREESKYQ